MQLKAIHSNQGKTELLNVNSFTRRKRKARKLWQFLRLNWTKLTKRKIVEKKCWHLKCHSGLSVRVWVITLFWSMKDTNRKTMCTRDDFLVKQTYKMKKPNAAVSICFSFFILWYKSCKPPTKSIYWLFFQLSYFLCSFQNLCNIMNKVSFIW